MNFSTDPYIEKNLHLVYANNKWHHLSPQQFLIFKALYENSPELVTLYKLENLLWSGTKEMPLNTGPIIHIAIHKIRKALSLGKFHIENVHGVGYSMWCK